MELIKHKIINDICDECWSGYPQECACGGMIHAEFGDENRNGDYWLEKECDRCGLKYEEWEA